MEFRANENEEELVRLYMGLTGASESCARSVYMLLCSGNEKSAEAPKDPEGLASKSAQLEQVRVPVKVASPVDTALQGIPAMPGRSPDIASVG